MARNMYTIHSVTLLRTMLSKDLTRHKSLVYPTVACELSGVVDCETSLFVALWCRPTLRLGISDRDKLLVSYL